MADMKNGPHNGSALDDIPLSKKNEVVTEEEVTDGVKQLNGTSSLQGSTTTTTTTNNKVVDVLGSGNGNGTWTTKWRKPAALILSAGVVVLLAAALLLGGFGSSYYSFAPAWMWTWKTKPEPGIPGNSTDILVGHPSWSKVNEGLGRCLPSLNETKDVEIRSFFDDARNKQGAAVDVNHAMNRYLYMAIMNAVVLGGRLRNTSEPWASGRKIGRHHVETYLDLLLNTMHDVEITAMDSSASQFAEMNQYLQLTMVQTSVLLETYPIDTITGPETNVTKLNEMLKKKEAEINLLLIRVEEMNIRITSLEVQLSYKVEEVVSLQSKCDLCSTQLKDCQQAAAAKGLDNLDDSKTKRHPYKQLPLDLHNDAEHFHIRGQFRR